MIAEWHDGARELFDSVICDAWHGRKSKIEDRLTDERQGVISHALCQCHIMSRSGLTHPAGRMIIIVSDHIFLKIYESVITKMSKERVRLWSSGFRR